MKILLLLNIFCYVALAKRGFGPGEQDYGYVTVRPQAHMFWWLYETTANVSSKIDKPLVIWLQGGPGGSSTGFGNFGELGPLGINLNPRKYSWVQDANVLFIDNPVGAGFSYVDDLKALTTTNKQIAEDLLKCLEEFYEKHSEFRNVPLYIAAESYGGKMGVEFSLELYKAKREKSDLKGIVLIDSWISPIDSVLTWATYLYNVGAVDKNGLDKINKIAQGIQRLLDEQKFLQATHQWGYLENLVGHTTYGISWYNILSKTHVSKGKYKDEADDLYDLMNGPVKIVLGLEVEWSEQSEEVFHTLKKDFMKPVTTIVEELLNTTNIKIVVTSGQLDLIVDTPGTVAWVDKLHWEGSKLWKNAPRKPLAVNNILEGYKKIVKRLSFYWVNRSGHMVPKDNPSAMRAILKDLMEDTSY